MALLAFLSVSACPSARADEPMVIGGHPARIDRRGHLRPWAPWSAAIEREMRFYRRSPTDHGYPRFVTTTFLDGDWAPDPDRDDTIPATQNGMGILSYLKLYALRGKRDAAYLDTARAMGDYLVREALTPDTGMYPRFSRSTGNARTVSAGGGLGHAGRSSVRDRTG